MTSNELKDLVKKHFSLVEADAVSNEEVITEEKFGELKDINGAFTVKFPGDSIQVGDKVTVVTSEGQEMDAPDGTHELEDGTKIVTKDSVVEEIMGADGEKALSEEFAEESVEEKVADIVEDAIEEVEMEEEAAPSIEDVVKEIVEAVSEEMGKMKEKMAELEEKVAGIADAPAADPVMKSNEAVKEFKRQDKFAAFDVSKAKNADRIEAAIRMMKNKK